jgi:hypothetical protein
MVSIASHNVGVILKIRSSKTNKVWHKRRDYRIAKGMHLVPFGL